jgi:hypothetical protein
MAGGPAHLPEKGIPFEVLPTKVRKSPMGDKSPKNNDKAKKQKATKKDASKAAPAAPKVK